MNISAVVVQFYQRAFNPLRRAQAMQRPGTRGRPAREMLCHTLLAAVIRSYQLETFGPGRSAKIYSTNLLR